MNNSSRFSGVFAALLLATAPVRAGLVDDLQGEDAKWTEQVPEALPPLPDEGALEPITLTGPGRHRHFVARQSVKVGADKVIRFVLVVKPAQGPLQSSYAGLRCRTGQWKTYAYAAAKGPWRPLAAPVWEDVESKSFDSVRSDLCRHFFCAGTAVAGNAEQLLLNLKRPVTVNKPR